MRASRKYIKPSEKTRPSKKPFIEVDNVDEVGVGKETPMSAKNQPSTKILLYHPQHVEEEAESVASHMKRSTYWNRRQQ